MTESAKKYGACDPACCCWSESPVHSKPMPGGSCFASASIASIACPALLPSAAWPWISMAATPLYRCSCRGPYVQRPVAQEVKSTNSILELEVEAGAGAQPADRRRIHGDDRGVLVGREMRRGARDHGLHRLVLRSALRPILEVDEDHALALPAPGEVVAVDHERIANAGRFLLEQVPRYVVEHDTRTALRCAGRRLHLDEEIPLILVRDERGREPREEEPHHDGGHEVDHGPASRSRHHAAHAGQVMVASPVELAVEPAEESVADRVLAGRLLEKRPAPRGRERRRPEHPQHDRRDDGRRELAVG